MRRLSDSAYRLKGQPMFQILAKVKELENQGRRITHFELGDPDFDTPQNIVEAACEALRRGDTHYAPSTGIEDLKESARTVTWHSRGFLPDPEQLLVCAGANVIIYYAISCIVSPGDEVIVPDPGFVSYFSIIDYLNVIPVRIPLREENRFKLDPDEVEKLITSRTRMIIINSPSNPTGAVMTQEEIEKIYKLASKYDLFILSDEIYARMVYDSSVKFSSPSQYDYCKERTIIVNGFSKSYAMTGWRLAVATGPKDVIEKMGLLLETTMSCVSPFIQRGGVEALRGDITGRLFEMVEEYKKRRNIMIEGLNSLPGISCLKPPGAFYAFPNIRMTGMSSNEFAQFILDRAEVALTPGSVFGIYGEGYVRLCYATSIENILRGIEKMGKVLRELKI